MTTAVEHQFAMLIGPHAEWFELGESKDELLVTPRAPLPARCTIRAAALFWQERGFPDVNTVMGRLCFARGDQDTRRYRPYTQDRQRELREVFLPIESMPEDDWPTSMTRWRNYETIARRLLGEAGVPWAGLTERDLDELVRFVPWPEPLEGCVLNALAQWTHRRGACVVEIGSLRGRSLSMLAMALRAVGSQASLISIDPHLAEPCNHAHVRLALEQLGEDRRLVQFRCSSDQTWRMLRPGCASMVFVDGDHSYAQVAADFEHYQDLLAPGGCLAFHDYGYGNHNGRPEADPEVRPAVDDHVMTDGRFQPLLLAHTLMAFVRR